MNNPGTVVLGKGNKCSHHSIDSFTNLCSSWEFSVSSGSKVMTVKMSPVLQAAAADESQKERRNFPSKPLLFIMLQLDRSDTQPVMETIHLEEDLLKVLNLLLHTIIQTYIHKCLHVFFFLSFQNSSVPLYMCTEIFVFYMFFCQAML